MVIWVFDCKAGVLIAGIHNVRAAVDCVGVTNAICGHVVIISYGEPPANHRRAHVSRTSGKIGPFGM